MARKGESTALHPNNRKFYLLIGLVLLAAVLAGVMYSGRSKSSVELWKAEQRAKGEKFTIAELLAHGINPPTNRVADLVRLGKVLGGHPMPMAGIEIYRHLSNGVAEAVWMRTNLGLTQVVGGKPASYEWPDLAADLAAEERALVDVHALLVVPDHDVGWNYDIAVYGEHCFVAKRSLAHWLVAAHTHFLHEGRPAEAGAHVTALLQLAAWHDEDYTLMSQMIRSAIGSLGASCLWGTLQAPGLTDAQLAGWQLQLQRLSIMPALVRSMEFERVFGEQDFAAARISLESAASMMHTDLPRPCNLAIGLAWRAFAAEGDELFYLRHTQEDIGILRTFARDHSWAAVQSRLAANRASLATQRGRLMPGSASLIPNSTTAFRNAVRHEGRREMTIAALALERFRRQHGRHPAALKELVPAFMSAVPVDWMDGQPLRYRLNADGTYTLWSIGEDLKDDGGDNTLLPGASANMDIWERRDAVWPRAAK